MQTAQATTMNNLTNLNLRLCTDCLMPINSATVVCDECIRNVVDLTMYDTDDELDVERFPNM
jgi:predicted amidophosphoribosyltransferase